MSPTSKLLGFATKNKRYTLQINEQETEETEALPTDISPITKINTNQYSMNSQHQYTPPDISLIKTWEEYRANLPVYEQTMIKNVNVINPTALLTHVENNDDIMVCSDGALKNTNSGGAFVISNVQEEILVTNRNPDTGHTHFQTSYRSEAQACYSAFLFIFLFCDFHQLQIPRIRYYCDNKGLTTRLTNKNEKPHRK